LNKNHKINLLKNRFRSKIYAQIKNEGSSKNYFGDVLKNLTLNERYDLLGIDFINYVSYVEGKFSTEMSFCKRNFHIDHILPLHRSLSKQEYIARWNFKNTEPIDPKKNKLKSSKYNFELFLLNELRQDHFKFTNNQFYFILFFINHNKRIENVIREFYEITHIGDISENNVMIKNRNKPVIKHHPYPIGERQIMKTNINSIVNKYLVMLDNPIYYFDHRKLLMENFNNPQFIFKSLINDYNYFKDKIFVIDHQRNYISLRRKLKSFNKLKIISDDCYENWIRTCFLSN